MAFSEFVPKKVVLLPFLPMIESYRLPQQPFALLPRRLPLEHPWEKSPQPPQERGSGCLPMPLPRLERQTQASGQARSFQRFRCLPEDQLAVGTTPGRRGQAGQLGRRPGLARPGGTHPGAPAGAHGEQRPGRNPGGPRTGFPDRLPILKPRPDAGGSQWGIVT